MSPPLPKPSRRRPAPSDPEALYDRLSVRDPAIVALWRHQSHVLTAFAHGHVDHLDVAIELPTGAGKTLVGALIAEWQRQSGQGVSAFVCTTQQLAQQPHAKAVGYGIDAVPLIGSNRDWSPAVRMRGMANESVIVTTTVHGGPAALGGMTMISILRPLRS